MPSLIRINDGEDDDANEKLNTILRRLFQSGNLNFIFGSGASMPAINIGGNIETQIQSHFDKGEDEKAYRLIYSFLTNLQRPNCWMVGNIPFPPIKGEADHAEKIESFVNTLKSYSDFIEIIERILNERKTNILPKQANIFTTNYDLFFEKASEKFATIKFNDGFTRTPNLNGKNLFSSQNFFNSLYNNGNLYGYKVEIPTINLIKIHGSLTWKKEADSIHFNTQPIPEAVDETVISQIQDFNSKFAVILPQKGKFREAVIDRTFYDLLRLYANELDKENTLLIAFGFSFEDEHIYDITKRALKNPTLRLMIFAFDEAAAKSFEEKFDGYSNVDIIAPVDGTVIDFTKLNGILTSLPGSEDK
jgi:SIR2-like domain